MEHHGRSVAACHQIDDVQGTAPGSRPDTGGWGLRTGEAVRTLLELLKLVMPAVPVHGVRAMRAAIVYNTRHESKNPCPLSQLSTLASPPRCSPEPSRCLARRGGQSARATCCCTQGLLDFLQTTLLRHRQATQARATPRTATAFHWRTARTPQAPASALSSPTGWPFPGTYAGRLPRLWQPLATQCPLCQGRAAGGHRQAALAH